MLGLGMMSSVTARVRGQRAAVPRRLAASWAASVAGCTSSGRSVRAPRLRAAFTVLRCASQRTTSSSYAAVAHQLAQLAGVAAEDRLAADVGLGVARAVPVEVVAARTPAPAVVLGDADLQVGRLVGQLDGAVGPADRQLPADVRLEGVRLLAVEHRVLVQRAPSSRRETRTVEEDAGAVDDPRLAAGRPPSRSTGRRRRPSGTATRPRRGRRPPPGPGVRRPCR